MHSVQPMPAPDCLERFKNDENHKDSSGQFVWNLSAAEHSELMRDLVRQFPSNQSRVGICAYCERLCDNRAREGSDNRDEADHFRPRDHFNHLMFEWENVMYVCRRCNTIKGKQFPGKSDDWSAAESNVEAQRVGKNYMSPTEAQGYVNPRETGAGRFFTFDASGKILANPDLDDSGWSKASRTILDLDLNHLDSDRQRDYCQRRTFALFMAYHSVRQLGERRSKFSAARMQYSSFIAWAEAQGYFDLEERDLPIELRNGFGEIR